MVTPTGAVTIFRKARNSVVSTTILRIDYTRGIALPLYLSIARTAPSGAAWRSYTGASAAPARTHRFQIAAFWAAFESLSIERRTRGTVDGFPIRSEGGSHAYAGTLSRRTSETDRAATYSLAIRRVSRRAVVIVPVTGSELSVWKARIEA